MEFSTGQSQIKVDEKGRISLPAHAQELLVDQSLVLSLSVYEKRVFLELLSPLEWQRKLKKMNELPQNHPRTKAIKRFLLSGSVSVSVDKQNRITVPQYQREALGLKREAVVIGLESKYELWSSQRWNETFGSLVEEVEELEAWAYDQDQSISDAEDVGESHDKLKPAA